MPVRPILALVVVSGLAACASAPASAPGPSAAAIRTDATLGRRIDDAIAANGPATLQWDLPDGRRAYQWQQASIE